MKCLSKDLTFEGFWKCISLLSLVKGAAVPVVGLTRLLARLLACFLLVACLLLQLQCRSCNPSYCSILQTLPYCVFKWFVLSSSRGRKVFL